MGFAKSRHLLTWLPLIIIMLVGSPMTAQQDTPDHLIHICVLPHDIRDPYLITFRDTDLSNHSVGFILPIKANIVTYGTETTLAQVAIYAYTPDAATGGYRRGGEIATASTRSDIQRSEACTNYTNVISEKNPTSIKLEVIPSQAVFLEFLQVNPAQAIEAQASEGDQAEVLDSDILATAPIIGAFSIQFRPNLSSVQQDIQLLQTSAGGIEVSFPGITEGSTRFIAIGNKDFGAQISFAEYPNEPLQPILANPRPNFQRLLQRQLFPVNSEATLDLYQLMKDINLRFYPYGGLIYEYPAQGFIRLDISPEPAIREPSFEPGAIIKPIEGAAPTYLAQENSEPRIMVATDEARVLEIDSNGQLIITGGRVGAGAVVDAWLVEVKPGS